MDSMALRRKRAVHPERLDPASLTQRASMSPTESWTIGSSSEDLSLSAPHPGLTVFSVSSDDFQAWEGPAQRPPTPLELDVLRPRGSEQSSTSTICQGNEDQSPTPGRSANESVVRQRLRALVHAFRQRALRFRQRLDLPPTPSTTRSKVGHAVQPPPLSQRPPSSSTPPPCSESILSRWRDRWTLIKSWRPTGGFDPQGYRYIAWLSLVTLCFLYNSCVIPLRSTFPYQTPSNTPIWLAFDYTSDAVYLIDVVIFKPRLMFLEDGFWISDAKLMRKNYVQRMQFKMDLLALLPLDFLYFKFGLSHLMFRLPRFFKIQSFNELYTRLDSKLPSPYIVRVARTVIYMLYMIHCNACAYYAFSSWEGIGSNGWVFSGEGNAYIRCFYFATKTATSIGKNPKPENKQEYVFMAWAWLMGVFVFALLLGQMRDIVVTATAVQNEYRKLLDSTIDYMRRQNLPLELQERVKLWFTFTWAQQRTLDERRITDWLPLKLKTDVAINVHIHTLSKVQLFQDCDETLLRELVLKLKPVIFLPKDYIIRKGEVGKEMFIVLSGQVQVVGGENDDVVFATLSEGSVFGEISLLALAGGNRRTATVRSHGFSNLFVLSKSDLNEAIEHHPEAQRVLKNKAQELVRENIAREEDETRSDVEVIIGNKVARPATPMLVHTVMQAVPPDSGTARLLRYGSRRTSRHHRLATTWEDVTSEEHTLALDKALSRLSGSSDGSVGGSDTRTQESRQSRVSGRKSDDDDFSVVSDFSSSVSLRIAPGSASSISLFDETEDGQNTDLARVSRGVPVEGGSETRGERGGNVQSTDLAGAIQEVLVERRSVTRDEEGDAGENTDIGGVCLGVLVERRLETRDDENGDGQNTDIIGASHGVPVELRSETRDEGGVDGQNTDITGVNLGIPTEGRSETRGQGSGGGKNISSDPVVSQEESNEDTSDERPFECKVTVHREMN